MQVEEKSLAQLFPDPEPVSRLVLPTPGFCIKSWTSPPSPKKMFINVCHCDVIPPPKDITHAELVELWSSEEDGNFRVPMSIGSRRKDRDRHGASCDVFDVALNTQFCLKVEKDDLFRAFVLQVIFEGIARKHNVDLAVSNGIVVLKNRKTMGSIQPHRIQVRAHNLIQDMPSPEDTQPAVTEEPRPECSRHLLMIISGELGKTFVGRFLIPGQPDRSLDVSSDLKLHLGEDRVRIQASALNFLVDIFIPCLIDLGHAFAKFDCQTDILTIVAPLKTGGANQA